MRKQVFGRKFKRDKNERKALFNGLISAMILKGRIETTEQKAKSIKPELEKLVTKAKKGESAKRLLQKKLKPHEIEKMITQIGPGFKNRPGGYTRIIKTGHRFNDDASMVILEWVEMEEVTPPAKVSKPTKSAVKPTKKTATKAKPAAKKPVVKKSARKAAK